MVVVCVRREGGEGLTRGGALMAWLSPILENKSHDHVPGCGARSTMIATVSSARPLASTCEIVDKFSRMSCVFLTLPERSCLTENWFLKMQWLNNHNSCQTERDGQVLLDDIVKHHLNVCLVAMRSPSIHNFPSRSSKILVQTHDLFSWGSSQYGRLRVVPCLVPLSTGSFHHQNIMSACDRSVVSHSDLMNLRNTGLVCLSCRLRWHAGVSS